MVTSLFLILKSRIRMYYSPWRLNHIIKLIVWTGKYCNCASLCSLWKFNYCLLRLRLIMKLVKLSFWKIPHPVWLTGFQFVVEKGSHMPEGPETAIGAAESCTPSTGTSENCCVYMWRSKHHRNAVKRFGWRGNHAVFDWCFVISWH